MNAIGLRTRWASVILMASTASVLAQAPGPGPAADTATHATRTAQPPPWLRALQGEEAGRVEAMVKQIDDLGKKGQFAEAVAAAREVLAIHRRAQGEDHWQTLDARFREQIYARAAALPGADRAALATAIRQAGEGEGLFNAGRWAEAEGVYRAALDVYMRVLGDEHPEVSTIRVNRAVSLHILGKQAEAEPLLRESLAAQLRALGRDHPDTASTHNNLAFNLQEQGRYAEAESLYRDALAIRQRILGEDHPDTAWSYENLAINLARRGRNAEAEPLMRRALAIVLRVLGEPHPRTASCFNSLACSLQTQGRYAEAEPLHRKALAIRRQVLGTDHPDTSSSDNNLALDLHVQGRYAEAEPFYQEALAIRRRVLGEDSPDTARSYDNLAQNDYARGRYAEAELLARRALSIDRRVLGEGHPETAYCFANLAVFLDAQGRYAEAEPFHRQALAIRRRVLGEDHPDTSYSRVNLARALDTRGKHAEAEPIHREALAIRRRVLGEDHPETARCYDNLGANHQAQGRYAEAEPLYREALAIRRRVLSEDHPDTAANYGRLAAILHLRGQDAEAEAMARSAAASYEAARPRISLDGLDRAEFASRQSPAPLLAALLARRARDVEAWERWESGLARGLFDDLEARRHQPLSADEHRRREELVDRLRRLDNTIGALAAATDDQRRRLDDVKGQRLDVQGQLARFEAEMVQKYRVAAGAVYGLDQIRAVLPADAALVGWLDLGRDPAASDPRGDHWACVVRRAGAPRWIRIAGTGPDRAWTEADDRRPGRVRELLGGADRSDWQGPLADLAAQRLGPLEAALGAVADQPAVRHLIVLPSPALAGIPIEAMLEARPPGAPRYLVSYAPSGTLLAWLQERRREDRDRPAQPGRLLALGDPVPPAGNEPMSPMPAPPDPGLLVLRVAHGSNAEQAGIRPDDVLLRYAGALLATRADLQKRVQGGDPRAAGVVVTVWRGGQTFDRTLRPGPLGVVLSDRPAVEALVARREADDVLRRARGATFARLPGSAREVRAIAGLFDRSEIYLGSDASERTLDSLRARDELATFAVIHLAAHGQVDDVSPLNSRLLLSQDGLADPTARGSLDGPAYDGILTAGEVLGSWKLRAELVTLSACRSGLGRFSGGEGHVGFAQAFFLAGARSLIVSLWEVDDRATSLLMTRFYRNWLGKRPGLDRPLSKAEALREAKAWLRRLTGSEVERELETIARGELRSRTSRPAADHPFAHPHDWAGFILMGDPD